MKGSYLEVAPLIKMLLLLFFGDDLVADATLGGAAVALDCVGDGLSARDELLAVRALHIIRNVFIFSWHILSLGLLLLFSSLHKLAALVKANLAYSAALGISL